MVRAAGVRTPVSRQTPWVQSGEPLGDGESPRRT
jgi:hypothetical protein